ncbi:MAG TPA: hypothetical protein VIU82_21740 [Bosea sp. (in: a-proteobacteria)]
MPLTYRKMLTEGLIGPIAVSAGASAAPAFAGRAFPSGLWAPKGNSIFPWPINVLMQVSVSDFYACFRRGDCLEVVLG